MQSSPRSKSSQSPPEGLWCPFTVSSPGQFCSYGPASSGPLMSMESHSVWHSDWLLFWAWCFDVHPCCGLKTSCSEQKPITESQSSLKENKSILKELNPEYSLEGLMLKLKLQYFGHLMWRDDLWKRPWHGRNWGHEEKGRAWGEGDSRGWGGWMASLTQWTWVWANSGSQWRTGKLQSMGSKRVGHDLVTKQQNSNML